MIPQRYMVTAKCVGDNELVTGWYEGEYMLPDGTICANIEKLNSFHADCYPETVEPAAVKPYSTHTYTDYNGREHISGGCPNCKSRVVRRIYFNDPESNGEQDGHLPFVFCEFCPTCGQKLNWKEN